MGTIAGIIRRQVARHLVAVIAVVLALLLRVTLERQSITLPTYVTFYPVVFFAAILGDMWTGILATTLSALLADYFLLPPVGQFAIHSTSDIAGLAIFCASGVCVSLAAELNRRRREKLAPSAIEPAILSERGNVEEPGELTETVRAKRQRFLGVLEALRSTGHSTVSSSVNPIGRIFRPSGRGSRFPSLNEKRFRASLRRTALVPFIAALILAGAALWAAYELNASMQSVDHTDQVIGQSRRLFRLLVDMETGERGFLVTGNEVFLQPYHEASKVIDSEYQKLYLLVADDPAQQARLKEVHVNLHHWRGYAEQMIALRRAGGAYTDLQINLSGKAEVDEIRDQVAGFQSVEEHVRDERNRTARRDWRLVATICILLGLGMGSGLALFVFRRVEVVAATFEESGRALAASEQRWATTLASIGDAVIAADSYGRITFLNPVAAALTGWRSEEALGQPIQNVFHIFNEQTRAPAEDTVNRVLSEGRTFALANHTALVTKDGREIPIADSAAPILDRDGKVTGAVLVFHDVTERRRAESVLESTLQRFYTVLSNLQSAVLLVTNEGRTEFANQGFCNMFGFEGSPAGQIGVDSAVMLERIGNSYQNPDQALRRIREIVASGVEVLSEEVPMRDGRTFLRDFVPLTVDGKPHGRLWAHRDITELKRTEQTLRESQAKLEAALASMTDSVIITDSDGRFVEFNDAYARFYRFKNKAECARSFDEFTAIFDIEMADGRPAPREMYAIQRALRGETATNVEYKLRRRDTGETWVGSLSFGPIRGQDGAIIGSVVTAREITEAKRIEEERQIAIDFLAMVNQSRGTKDLLQRATAFFQQRSGCEAVGIRLREGDDYPYFEARGFSNEFVQVESRLCTRSASGNILKDSTGVAVLECLCGNVIRGCVEISKPFYTAHGSFWCNSTTELIAGAGEGDLPASTRNRCNREGYESVALFPIYTGEERFGLLQLVDCRKGRFSAQNIVLWERLAGHLATAVSKFQAEEALRASEEKHRLLAESIRDPFFALDSDLRFTFWSQRTAEFNGVPPEIALGKTRLELFGESESQRKSDAMCRQCLDTQKPLQFEVQWTFGGNARLFDVQVFPYAGGVATIGRDITERKRMEEALRSSQEQIQAIIDGAPDTVVFLKDIDGRFITVNSRFEEMLGITRDEVRGKTDYDILTRDRADYYQAHDQQVLATGQPMLIEELALLADGKEHTLLASKFPLFDASGKPYAVCAISVDITERKRMEEALRESEERYRSLFNSMNEGFCIVEVLFDADGRPEDYCFLEVNDAFEKQTGLHDAVGKRMRELAPAHEAHWYEIYGKIALTGEPAHFMNEAKALNRVYDVHAYRVGEPEQRRVAIVFNDFSDYKRAEEELRRSEKLDFQRQQLQALAERLQQAREEERKMVARDLHDDIGQILTAIKMDMKWMVRHLPKSKAELHERLEGSIELINGGAQSVRRICSGLRPGALDDLGLVAAIEWQANEFASRTGISVTLSLPPAELRLDGDRSTAIFRIFQECLTNVARHAEAKVVRTSLYEEGEDLVLEVEDDGKGFHESDAAGSLGVLGMKERAQVCGGSAQVSSGPGQGTTVTVRVPLRAANVEREDHAHPDIR